AGTVLEDAEHASASLNVWSMFSDLLSELGGLPDAKDPKPRKDDLLLPLPYTRELHATIHCPEGYRPGALPPARTRSFGPATLTQSFQAAPDGTVTASFRLDTGKRVWSASEVEEARQAIKTLGDEDVFVVRYDQVGEAALQAGQAKEAIEAFQALAKAHPGKASPLLHYANALLAVGLGEEARAQAKLAVQAEPGSVRTHSALAWIEQHDLVGRRFGKGWDRAGALAEYRKAMALDPKDYAARGNLSILLEYGTDGIRYSRTADLPEAVKVLQGIRTDLDRHDLDLNLVVDLAKLGRFDEAVKIARAMPAGASRNAWLACALVAQLGQERGLAALAVDLPDPGARRAALSSAADQLLRLRKYPEAAALLRLGSEGSSDMAAARQRAELFDRTRRFDAIPAATPGPIAVVERMLQRTMLGGTVEEMRALISPATFDQADVEKTLDRMPRSIARTTSKNDLPIEVALDLALSHGQFAADGDDAKGYRVTSRSLDGGTQTYFVDRMDGSYRIVATSTGLGDFGLQALWYLDHGQRDRAAAWLDQARQLVSSPPADDAAGGSPFARLWTRGDQAPPERLRLAALVLASAGDISAADLARKLADLRPRLKDPQEAIAADVALALVASTAKVGDLALAASARLIQEAPRSLVAMRIRAGALAEAGQIPEAIAYAQARMAEHPELEDLQAAVSSMQGSLGQFEAGEQGLQRLIDR
ncbi:MAG TPA: tetratricopeptide repeat protein, partial [Holophagaceae bacterium]|nr:tetratricopeptide repeat protein [Holophagaceae bacterium]